MHIHWLLEGADGIIDPSWFKARCRSRKLMAWVGPSGGPRQVDSFCAERVHSLHEIGVAREDVIDDVKSSRCLPLFL